jgi:DNA-binding response OmpR family regulator
MAQGNKAGIPKQINVGGHPMLTVDPDRRVKKKQIVDVHIRHLCGELEDDPRNPRWLIAARGIGYKSEP